MTLNRKQLGIVIASAVVFIAMGLYPPWTYTVDYAESSSIGGGSSRSSEVHSKKPAGYALIVAPPTPEQEGARFGVRLDISRLVVQWIVLAAATGGAVLLAKGPRSE